MEVSGLFFFELFKLFLPMSIFFRRYGKNCRKALNACKERYSLVPRSNARVNEDSSLLEKGEY